MSGSSADARRNLQVTKDVAREVREKKATASSRREAADDLEKTIAATEVSAVSEEERQDAEGRLTAARARAEKAIAAAGERAAHAARPQPRRRPAPPRKRPSAWTSWSSG